MKTLLLILIGFTSGLIGSCVFADINSSLGFVLGIVIFLVIYCAMTFDNEPTNSTFNEEKD